MSATSEVFAREGRSLLFKSTVAVALGSAALLAKYAIHKASSSSYDGMDSIVSFSSRMIAAARALEDDEEDSERIVFDPLAKRLAGRTAMGKATKRRVKAAQGSRRHYKVGRIAVRTRWFDDQLEECLGMPRTLRSFSKTADHIVSTMSSGSDGKMHFPTQVVELGAGLSTRPWRLHLPAVLKWYDVDKQDVIDVKENLLLQHGAEVDVMSPMRRSQSKNSLLERKIGSLDHHSLNVDFPIRCESRSSVAADIGSPHWMNVLLAAGFDVTKPTVWIAEGLLMYLEGDRVDTLLKEIASMSAPGSCFLTGVVTQDCIQRLQEEKTKHSLMKEWRSGCPQDPRPWLESLGWTSQLITTRPEIAQALGLSLEDCSFDASPVEHKNARGFFIVATVNA